jgi:monoamine oxidase
LPPKLWANRIKFDPQLPGNLINIAHKTHTWMEDSIKVALTFSKPFWEEQNLPRTLFSKVGPVTEFYDHCDFENSKFALCGFINSSFKQFSVDARKELVLYQLKTIFGAQITGFLHYEERVWSEEYETFQDSKSALFPHQNNGNSIFSDSLFDDRLIISSTETSPQFPGYMEGAVLSGILAAKKIIEC